MIAKNIYNLFCIKCYSIKNDVREFRSYKNNAIILFMKDFGQPLVFTVVDVNKGYWKLEPVMQNF